jgi:hypothetical protein
MKGIIATGIALVGLLTACGASTTATGTGSSGSTDHSSAVQDLINANEDVVIDQAGWIGASITSANCLEQGSTQSYACVVVFTATQGATGLAGTWTAQIPAVCNGSGSCQIEASTSIVQQQ